MNVLKYHKIFIQIELFREENDTTNIKADLTKAIQWQTVMDHWLVNKLDDFINSVLAQK